MNWRALRATGNPARSRAGRRSRLLQFSTCEPRLLLAGFVFDPVQVLNAEQTLAPNTPVTDVDVNGDGDPDLVALQEQQILVFDNDRGQLTLRAQPARPKSELDPDWNLEGTITGAADLDSDGDHDLILRTPTGHGLWIENGDSQGGFERIHFITSFHSDVTPGDLDGDGDLDLIETRAYASTITWYENTDGRGHYLRSHRFAASDSGQVHIADIDADDDLDLVVRGEHDVRLYRNTGLPSADWPVTVLLQNTTNHVFRASELLNFDDNPWPDLAISSESELVPEAMIVYDIGVSYDTASLRTQAIAPDYLGASRYLADVNGDKRLDAIISAVEWHVQRPDGSFGFAPGPIHTIRSAAISVLPRDWDGDQDIDILFQLEDRIQWLENLDGKGDFGTQAVPWPSLEVDGEVFRFGEAVSHAVHTVSRYRSVNAMHFIDWSGDGVDDLMTESYLDIGKTSVTLQWYPMEKGRLERPQTLFTGPVLSFNGEVNWTAADVDGDSLPDLALASNNSTFPSSQIQIYRHQMEGQPLLNITSNDSHLNGIELIDIDADGDRDLFYIKDPFDWLLKQTAYWMENTDGRGTFGEAQVLVADLADEAKGAWHDITGDGRAEFVTVSQESITATLQVWAYDVATRSVGLTHSQVISDVLEWRILDLDGDGLSDLLHMNWSNHDWIVSWNRGLGTPFPQETLIVDYPATLIDSGDVDSDGDQDLLFRNYQQLDWLENSGPARRWDLHAASDLLNNFQLRQILTSDLDGDHDVELIAVSDTDSRMVVLQNRHGNGDWSKDKQLDRADLDVICLSQIANSVDLTFDVDLNGQVDAMDVKLFRQRTLDVNIGDIDDDGQFASSDLVLLMQRGQFESDVQNVALWSDGDFDCNGRFETHDLVVAMAETGYSHWKEEPPETPLAIDESTVFDGEDGVFIDFALTHKVLQADIDADGDDDLLIPEGVYQTWYRNDGPDRPLVHLEYVRAGSVLVSTTADIDGDGDLDWSLSGRFANYWLENTDGRGCFTTRHDIDLQGYSNRVAPQFTDWDHDGDLDMIAVQDGNAETSAASIVLIENTDGRGTFQETLVLVPMQALFYRSRYQLPFDLTDIDNDGWVDVVDFQDGWYRNRQGSFQEVERISFHVPAELEITNSQMISVVAVDLDHDGDDDLVRNDSEQIFFAYNNSTGQFTHVVSGIAGDRFAVTDADKNGRWELLYGYRTSDFWSEQSEAWTNPVSAGFETTHSIQGKLPFPPAFVDRDGDKRPDLIVVTDRPREPLLALVNESPDRISWNTAVPLLKPLGLDQIETLDVDGDERLDLLVRFARLAELQWIGNLGTGRWAEPVPAPPKTLWGNHLQSLDVDLDGDIDVSSSNGWWENQPGTVRSEWTFHDLPLEAVDFHDMDADGDLDLVSFDQWIANDHGTFSPDAAVLLPLVPSDQVMGVGDFNQDGHVDLLTRSGAVYYRYADLLRERYELENAGNRSMAIWDLDRDGDLDIVSGGSQWNENEGGRFLPTRPLHRTRRPGVIQDLALADFDGDGFQELIESWVTANDLVKIDGLRDA